MTRVRESRVLVTGASSGIGAATALEAARRGADVALLARNAAALERVAEGVRAHGARALVVPVDLSDPEQTTRALSDVRAAFGTPDVLVNNAGAGRWRAIDETDDGEAQAALDVPYLAAFRVTRAFLPGMLLRGSGTVVNVTSPFGFVALPGASAYGVARWAMRALDRQLHADLRGTRVRAMLLVPGLVDSGYFQHNPGTRERLPAVARLIPPLTPEQVAGALLDGVQQDRRMVVIPPALRVALAAAQVLPGPADTLAAWGAWRRGRAGQGGKGDVTG